MRRATDLEIELREHDAEGESAHWIARYTFGATGRHVVNDVQASFRFADGLIATTSTSSTSAAGPSRPSVRATTWVPPLRAKVRAKALAQLEDFKRGETGSSL